MMSNTPDFGLWGTSDHTRIAVSLTREDPEPVLGYVVEVGAYEWVVENDASGKKFDTPREAAEHGYAVLWRRHVDT